MIRSGKVRAGLLLEVVVAMSVLVTAMGFLGAQLVTGINMTTSAEEQMRAAQVTDYVLALIEFDLETQSLIFTEEEEFEYEFPDTTDEEAYWRLPERFPGYFWRVRVESVEPQYAAQAPQLVTVEILYQSDPELRDDIDDARLVRKIAFLRGEPPSIEIDELMPDDEALAGLPEEIADQLPDLLSLFSGFESGRISIHELVSMLDEETLEQLMPIIQQLMGQYGELSAEQMQQFLQGGGMLSGGQQFLSGLPGAGGGGRRGQGRPGAGDGGGRMGGGGRGEGLSDEGGGGRGRRGGMSIEDLIRMRDEYARREGG